MTHKKNNIFTYRLQKVLNKLFMIKKYINIECAHYEFITLTQFKQNCLMCHNTLNENK